MTRAHLHLLTALLFGIPATLQAHSQSSLQTSIAATATQAQGQVSVACFLPGTPLDCNLHPNAHVPMQSVMKLPLAVYVLHLVDTGRLHLDQPVHFAPNDLWPGTHSPIQDAHPTADVDLPLRDVLRSTVAESDNIGANLLVRLVGGTAPIRAYLASLGLPGIRLLDDERALQSTWAEQYLNWAEPSQFVLLLRRLASPSTHPKPSAYANPSELSSHSPLTPASTALLLRFMTESSTGPHRLRGNLPPGTPVAHKTGSSGIRDGITAATNDVGLLTLPDGRQLALAIFVTNSRANEATRDHVIAAIARQIFDAATGHPTP